MKQILSEMLRGKENNENQSHKSKPSVVNSCLAVDDQPSSFCAESSVFVQSPLGPSQLHVITLPDLVVGLGLWAWRGGVIGRTRLGQDLAEALGRRLKKELTFPLCGWRLE